MNTGGDILLPETRTMEIAGEEVTVSELTLKQLIELGRVVMDTMKVFGQATDQELLAKMLAGQTSIAEDIFAIVEALDEEHLAWLFSVLIDRDREWCVKHVGVDAALDILLALQDVQDLGEIVGKVRRLIGKLMK